jgi:excisionase family DNA binding protein
MTIPAQRGNHPTDLMTVAEAASTMRVSKMTVYRLLQAGEIAALRIGRSFRIERADLSEYLRICQLSAPPEAPGPEVSEPEPGWSLG